MRRTLAALAVAAVALPAAAPSGTAASPDRCRYGGKRVVLKTARVAVLARPTSLGTELQECHRASGATDTLNDPELGETVFRPPAMAIASTTVGLALNAEGGAHPDHDGTSVAVDRWFADGEAGHRAGWVTLWAASACLDPEEESRFCRVVRVVVRPSGSAAWTICPARGCARSAVKAVFRFRNADLSGAPRDAEPELLARGRGIDPHSLRRDGGRIRWVEGGRRRSAAL